jgi:hypothetical protein
MPPPWRSLTYDGAGNIASDNRSLASASIASPTRAVRFDSAPVSNPQRQDHRSEHPRRIASRLLACSMTDGIFAPFSLETLGFRLAMLAATGGIRSSRSRSIGRDRSAKPNRCAPSQSTTGAGAKLARDIETVRHPLRSLEPRSRSEVRSPNAGRSQRRAPGSCWSPRASLSAKKDPVEACRGGRARPLRLSDQGGADRNSAATNHPSPSACHDCQWLSLSACSERRVPSFRSGPE